MSKSPDYKEFLDRHHTFTLVVLVLITMILTALLVRVQITTQTAKRAEKARIIEVPEQVISTFDGPTLQAAVDEYIGSSSSVFSVDIRDAETRQVLATHNPDQTYFSASQYKLYFAFLAWQDVDAGLINLGDELRPGQTYAECLDLMIRESDSPCGEALLTKYSYSEATQRLKDLGLSTIDTGAFQVSAADMSTLLQHIHDQKAIEEGSALSLLLSMEQQIYDAGIKRGFAGYTVQDKVGFSPVDWHDTALIEIDDKTLIVTIFSENANRSGVFGLSSAIEASL